MTTKDSQSPFPDSDTITPSKGGKILKWLTLLIATVVLVLLVLGLLLTYLFPSELARQELEVRGSDMLEGKVRIHSLSFNLLTGFELKKVQFLKADHSRVNLHRLNLDYSLWELFQQRLKINEVKIEGADVFLDLATLATLSEADEEQIEPSTSELPTQGTTLPLVPLVVDLDALEINRSTIHVVVNPTMELLLRDLNVNLTGRVDQDTAELAGELNVADMSIDLENKTVRLPLGIEFAVGANLPQQHLDLQTFTVQSHPGIQFTLSGQVRDFLSSPTVGVALQHSEFDLGNLLRIGQEFIPSEFREIVVDGTFSPKMTLKGALPDSGFEGTVEVMMDLKQLQTNLPLFHTSLQPTDVSLRVFDGKIKDNVPESASFQVVMDSQGMAYQDYVADKVTLKASGDFFALGPVSGKVKLSGVSVLPPLGDLGSLTLPLDVEMEGQGNYRLQEFNLKKLGVRIGELLDLGVHGSVHPTGAGAQAKAVSLVARLEPHLEHILPLIPQKILEGLTIIKQASPDSMTVDVKGVVDSDFQAQEVDVTAGINVSGLTASFAQLSAEGTLQDLSMSVSTTYQASSGGIQGTVSSALHLTDLDHGGLATVGKTNLTLGSNFTGKVSPAFELLELVSKDAVTLQSMDILYDDGSLSAEVPELALSSKTTADIFGHKYSVEDLRITGDPLFDLELKGQYQLEDQEFQVTADVPYLDVGEVLSRVSGELVQGLRDIHPGGTVSLAVQAMGRVPQPEDLERLTIPVELTTTLSLQDIEGTVAGYQVKGASGSVTGSFGPGDSPVANVTSEVRVKDIGLAPTFPVKKILGGLAKLDVSVRDFDEVSLKDVQLGMKGAAIKMNGSVTGVKDFLTGEQELGKMVGNLFAQTRTNVSIDLDEFQELLGQMGLVGSGRAEVGLSVLKKEQGPLDVQLSLGAHNATLSQQGMKMANLDGGLTLRKRLIWDPEAKARRASRRFIPTDILSQLQTITKKGKRVRIELLDLGFLTLSNFSTNFLFDGKAIKIQNMAMDLLGGGLGGNLILTTGEAFGASARFEAARLDLNHLLESKDQISGDSVVDATIDVKVFFEKDTGGLDLGRTEFGLFITHIGREALDRLLFFLDPEGSNPTLVNARSQVKLANPSRVTIQLVRGMMSLEIRFSEGLLSSFTMDRIPVGKMKNLQTVTQGIPSWDMITQSMNMIGAESYGVDSQGQLLLQ